MVKNAIITEIKRFFETQDWKYDYFEEDSMFQTAVALEEGNGVMIHAIVGEAMFTVMVASDFTYEPQQFDEVRAFVNAVNERLLLGTLILDCEEGILYFRVGQVCTNQAPNGKIVEDSFMYPISFMDENFKTFTDLSVGAISAQEALDQIFAGE